MLASGFVDLSPFVRQRTTIEAAPAGTAPGATPSLNVTDVQSEAGYEPALLAVITGTLEAMAQPLAEGLTHTITEASTDDVYGLFSDEQGVDLSQYKGRRGTERRRVRHLPDPGRPISDFEDPTDVLIYATSVESLEPSPVAPTIEATTEVPTEEDGGATVVASLVTGESVLPGTGGLPAGTLGVVLSLLAGGGLLTYGLARHR